MTMSAILFAFAMIDNILLLFINIYNIITLSDLEADLINPKECCRKLDQTFLPEIILHLILPVFFLFTNHWFLLFLNIPLDIWFAYKYFKRPTGQIGFHDPLEINNRGNIKTTMRNFLIRLPVYLIYFFIYLFLLIQALM